MTKPECVFRWDKTPAKPYRGDTPIEEAVTNLIKFHNTQIREYPKSMLEEGIDESQDSHKINRAIEYKDVVIIRVTSIEGARDYFSGCYFLYDGENARLDFYNQNLPEEKTQKISRKQTELGLPLPITVGDYGLLKRENQNLFVLLQVARFGIR